MVFAHLFARKYHLDWNPGPFYGPTLSSSVYRGIRLHKKDISCEFEMSQATRDRDVTKYMCRESDVL